MEAVYEGTHADHQAQFQYLRWGEVFREVVIDILIYSYRLGGDLRVADYRSLGVIVDSFWQRVIPQMVQLLCA